MLEDRSRVMTVEKRRDLRPVHRRHLGWHGDSRELWSHLGMDVESMSPKARAVIGVVTGGAILLAAALLVLFTDLWWLILIFCWIVFPALGIFARGVAGLMESRTRRGCRKLARNGSSWRLYGIGVNLRPPKRQWRPRSR